MRKTNFARGAAVAGVSALLCIAYSMLPTTMNVAATQPQQPTSKPAEQTVDQLHENIQVLKGLPESHLVPVMNFMAASLGVRCNFCHVNEGEKWDFAADTKKEKGTAREMIRMVLTVNKTTFKGTTEISCWTCHRGRRQVPGVPTLPLTPVVARQTPATREQMPAADQLLTKYLEALGGTANLDKVKTKIMKGAYVLPTGESMSYEVHQAAPDRFYSKLVTPAQVFERVFDGNIGWIKNSGPNGGTKELVGEQLIDFKRYAQFFRDIKLKEQFARLNVAGKDKVGDRDAYVVRATTADNKRERLFFDVETGLLLRRITYTDTIIGIIPEQTDFSDYRDVDGVKVPFTVQVSSVDPFNSATRKFAEIRFNAAIEDSKFKKP